MRIVPYRAALVALGLLAQPACSGGRSPDGLGATQGKADAACEAARAKVEGLYRAAAGEATPGEAAEARAREVADNADMALWDCRHDPARVAPCLQSAASAAQLERECLVPLDDDGAVEGAMFSPPKRQ